MLEQVVRPFASNGTIVSGRIVPSRNKKAVETAELIWGSIGTMPTAVEEPPGTTGLTFTVKDCDTTFVENPSGRVNKDIRVENKDDSSQFLVIRRIEQFKVQKAGKNQQSESYVAYAVTQAMKQFDASFEAGIGPDKCVDTYKLNWPE